MTWQDGRDAVSLGWDVYGRRVSGSGAPHGPDLRISTSSTTTNEQVPAVAYSLSDHQFIVVWTDDRDFATLGQGVYRRRVPASGPPLGSDFRVSGSLAFGDEHDPVLAEGAEGHPPLVAWQDSRNAESQGTDIYGRLLDTMALRLAPMADMFQGGRDSERPASESGVGLSLAVSEYASGAAASPTSSRSGFTPTVVSAGGTSCAVSDTGNLKCWGHNNYGQLGLGDTDDRGYKEGDMGSALPAVDVGEPVSAVSSGYDHTCALLASGGVKCWGFNRYGQLGTGDTEPRGDEPDEMSGNLPIVDLGEPAVAVVAGANHTCALLVSGAVKCWGDNGGGQLGTADTALFHFRGGHPGEMGANLPAADLGDTALAITSGQGHTCALLSSGAVKCWGSNSDGQIGLGDTLKYLDGQGDDPGEMGDNLPVVDLGGPATAVSAGLIHTCALLVGGTVKCWGNNIFGQLGLGDTEWRGDDPGEMGDNLPAVDLGGRAIAISAGLFNSCALLIGGVVKCWGANDSYELGLGDTEHRGDEPGEMGDNLPPAILGGLEPPLSAVAISTGFRTTCAMDSTGQPWCWGLNCWGQTGQVDPARQYTTVPALVAL